MGYSKDVLLRARARLEQEKMERETENRRNLEIAYEQQPRLKEIDRQLHRTMVQTVHTAFSRSADVQSSLAQIKEANRKLRQERAELIAACFVEGFLDDNPICSCCGGTGYIGSTMCECLAELCRQEQKKDLSVLTGVRESFAHFRLDYYSNAYDPRYQSSPRNIMERNLEACRRYAATFSENTSSNLLFVGGTGLGKTFLAACIARTVADRGYSVCYETAPQLFSKLERARFNGNEAAREAARKETEKYTTADLLIIDDLGTEMTGQFVTASLYDLLDERLRSTKPMIITTNLNVDEAGRRYSPQIASRLYGNFVRYTFVGEDIRVIKNKVMP